MSGAGDYLERIVPEVTRRLEERRAQVPLDRLKSKRSEDRASFAAAIGGPGVSLVAEVKRASPSRGAIRPDLDVAELVVAYESAGAQAISVLTEEDFFLGSLDDLRSAAEKTQLPLLRKDFVVDEYQLYEARAAGASAILLIAALLDERRLQEFSALAGHLGLDFLLEVHDQAELQKALTVDHAVLGINNRDLHTFETSLETTERLAELVPSDRLLVSESGIRTHDDILRLAAVGVDAVLVGESLLVSGGTGAAVRLLMEPRPAPAARSGGTQRPKEVR